MKNTTVRPPAAGAPRQSFSHFSKEIIEEFSPVRYEQEIGVHQKPAGLWLSVDGEYDWQWWCENESFGIGAYRHAVTLRQDANVLAIRTVDELDAFARRYLTSIRGWFGSMAIDWPQVARDYSAIVIAPYQWERRIGPHSWYYTWDCASACVWDLSAIAEWSALPPVAAKQEQLIGTGISASPDSEKEKGGAS